MAFCVDDSARLGPSTESTCHLSTNVKKSATTKITRVLCPRVYLIISGASAIARLSSRMALIAGGVGRTSIKTGVTGVTGVAEQVNLLKIKDKAAVTLAVVVLCKRCNGTTLCNIVLNLSAMLEATNVRFRPSAA
jgi:hypothetical protein